MSDHLCYDMINGAINLMRSDLEFKKLAGDNAKSVDYWCDCFSTDLSSYLTWISLAQYDEDRDGSLY